jgi:hypothetical protein
MDDIEFKRTCYACPEQYDVFLGTEQIGYLRLRHGYFAAYHPDVDGSCVFQAYPKGDGIFEEDERGFYLSAALEALLIARERDLPIRSNNGRK